MNVSRHFHSVTDTPSETKEQERERLARDIAEFQSRGGVIQVIQTGEGSQEPIPRAHSLGRLSKRKTETPFRLKTLVGKGE